MEESHEVDGLEGAMIAVGKEERKVGPMEGGLKCSLVRLALLVVKGAS